MLGLCTPQDACLLFSRKVPSLLLHWEVQSELRHPLGQGVGGTGQVCRRCPGRVSLWWTSMARIGILTVPAICHVPWRERRDLLDPPSQDWALWMCLGGAMCAPDDSCREGDLSWAGCFALLHQAVQTSWTMRRSRNQRAIQVGSSTMSMPTGPAYTSEISVRTYIWYDTIDQILDCKCLVTLSGLGGSPPRTRLSLCPAKAPSRSMVEARPPSSRKSLRSKVIIIIHPFLHCPHVIRPSIIISHATRWGRGGASNRHYYARCQSANATRNVNRSRWDLPPSPGEKQHLGFLRSAISRPVTLFCPAVRWKILGLSEHPITLYNYYQ